MLREVFRRNKQVAKKAMDHSYLDWAECLQSRRKKVDVEFTTQVPPGGTMRCKSNKVSQSDSGMVYQNATIGSLPSLQPLSHHWWPRKCVESVGNKGAQP